MSSCVSKEFTGYRTRKLTRFSVDEHVFINGLGNNLDRS